MTTFLLGVPRGDPTASTLRTTSMPSVTFPNTVCRPSNLHMSCVCGREILRQWKGEDANQGNKSEWLNDRLL